MWPSNLSLDLLVCTCIMYMCVHLLCTCVYRLYCVCALLFLCIEILMQWQVVFPITNVFILFYTMYIIHIFLYPISLITTEILVRVLVALQLLLSQIRWTILLILGSTMCRIMYVLPLTARSMWWAYWLVWLSSVDTFTSIRDTGTMSRDVEAQNPLKFDWLMKNQTDQ